MGAEILHGPEGTWPQWSPQGTGPSLPHPLWAVSPDPHPTPPSLFVLDLLRAVGSRSWLVGLVPWGFHPGSHGVLWSLELGHLHVSLAVCRRTWGLGDEEGLDSLGLP